MNTISITTLVITVLLGIGVGSIVGYFIGLRIGRKRQLNEYRELLTSLDINPAIIDSLTGNNEIQQSNISIEIRPDPVEAEQVIGKYNVTIGDVSGAQLAIGDHCDVHVSGGAGIGDAPGRSLAGDSGIDNLPKSEK